MIQYPSGKARKRRMRLSGVAFAVACVASVAAGAAELSDLALEDLLQVDVVSASRFSQTTVEAPASVSVIGEDELRSHGYRNLAEALVTLPGVYSSGDRAYTFLGVRGFNRPGDYGTRLLLLTDGARRNDPLYDQALFGNEAPIEIDWVKRLEFVSGPASAVYGANALFGTVNTVMLNGADINGYRVTLDAGSDASKRVGLVAGQRLEGDRDWFVGFAAYKSDGSDFYYPAFDNGATDGHARGLDGENYQKLYAKYRWGNWRLAGNLSTREKDVPTAWYETAFGKSGTSASDSSRLIELRYDGDVNNGWQPSFRAYNGSYRFGGEYRYEPPPNTRDRAYADWTGGELHMAYTGFQAHKLAFGIDGQWNTRLEQRYYEVGTGNTVLDTNNPSHVVGLFAQDEWRFHPEWLLNVGLRYDKHSDFDGELSPRAALIWQPAPRLSLKAIVGSAYRTPNAFERFYDDGGTLAANPGVQPEKISSAELAAAYRFGQSGRVGVSVYNNRIKGLIDQAIDASGVSRFANQDRIRARGVEVDAENTWSGDYRLRGSVTWQRSEDKNGTSLVDSPRLLGKVVFGMPVAFGWTATGEVLGVTSRHGDNGPVPGYGIVNLSIASAPAAHFGQFSLAIYNLGDHRYFDPTSSYMLQESIEQDGRQFRLRWTLPL